MKVGYTLNDYANQRNIIGTVPDVHYRRVYDLYKGLQYASKVANRVCRRTVFDSTDLAFRFNDLNLNRVDLIHFFNAISFGKTPWVTTFETIAPRFKSTLSRHHGRHCDYAPLTQEPQIHKALAAMAGDACKQLIALSHCNFNMQLDLLQHFPQYEAAIAPKLICLPPPQPLLVQPLGQKPLPLDQPIHFLFVGRAFFRKGGMALLEAFQEAHRHYGNALKLTIVSSLTIDNYATQETIQEVTTARQQIAQHEDWIDYYPQLPNAQVIELMQTAHVGLLPTYADTYGYSVLEFQAAGCPVISTNIRALSELNDDRRGWLIKIPQNRLGEALYTTAVDREEIATRIKQGLLAAIADIMTEPPAIARKAAAAIQYIQEQHAPDRFAQKLKTIYQQAVA